MPLRRPRGIDQQAVVFRRPQAQASTDALIEQHLRLGRTCQHDAVNRGLIKAFGEDRTGHQGIDVASPHLVVDGLAFLDGRLSDDSRRLEPCHDERHAQRRRPCPPSGKR